MIARGFKLLLVLAVLAQTSTAIPKEDEIKWGTNIACTWIIFTIIQTYEQICRPTSNDGFQIFLKEALPQLRDAVTRKGLLTKEQIEEFQSGRFWRTERRCLKGYATPMEMHRGWPRPFAPTTLSC